MSKPRMVNCIPDNVERIVGKLVYKTYTPQRCGKVIEDLGRVILPPHSRPTRVVVVKWIDGKHDQVAVHHLQDFEALIANHRTKFERHSKTAERLRQL